MSKDTKPAKKGQFFKIGFGLLAATVPLWLSPLYVPFTPFSVSQKVGIVITCLIIAEIFFWAGALLVGREVANKYKDRLDPRTWKKK